MSWSVQDAANFELELRDTKALDYDREYAALHGASFRTVEVRLLHRALDLRRDDVVLDLGCGTGRITEALASTCAHVVAVDRSSQSLAVLADRMRRRGLSNVTVVKADATEDLPVNRNVSKVVCIQLLQHVPVPADRVSILRGAARWLATGGKLVVIDEMFGLIRKIRRRPQEIALPKTLYFRAFTPVEMRETVRAAGLRPLRLVGCGVLHWTRYRFAPDVMIWIEDWASGLPGAAWIARFGAVVAVKD